MDRSVHEDWYYENVYVRMLPAGYTFEHISTNFVKENVHEPHL